MSNFKKIQASEITKIIENQIFQKPTLIMKDSLIQKSVKIKMSVIDDETDRIYILLQEVKDIKNKICTISFKVGPATYFFKDKIQSGSKGFFVKAPTELYQHTRRKDLRFEANIKYPIQSQVLLSKDGKLKIESYLMNLSASGARLLVETVGPKLKKGSEIKLHLKPENSVGITVSGLIRSSQTRLNHMTELGLEFNDLTHLETDKINKICDELSKYFF